MEQSPFRVLALHQQPAIKVAQTHLDRECGHKAACTLSTEAQPTGRREESGRGTHELVRHVACHGESGLLSTRSRMAVAVDESDPGPGDPRLPRLIMR